LRVAEDPGLAYNPMYVWGPPGIGKTHLVAALIHYAREINPELRARYVTSEGFTEEFVAAVRGPGTAPMREQLRRLDVLVLDDAHFLAGRAKTQQELLHTFDSLISRGGQIVIASEQPPTAIDGLSESLRDRFDSGLAVEMTRPDLATRIAVISRVVSRGLFPVPDNETLARIAELAPANFRRLDAALTRVLAHASLLGRRPSADLAEEALRDSSTAVQAPRSETSSGIDEIVAAVCSTQHISAAELRSKRRTPDVVRARRVAMYLAREAGLSLAQIGHAFDRDHSTVISALRTVERNLEPGDELHTAVETARRELE
jgi:chromosomal replication initiator protein